MMQKKKQLGSLAILVLMVVGGIAFIVFRQTPKEYSEEVPEVSPDSLHMFSSPSKNNVHAGFQEQINQLRESIKKDPRNVSHMILLAQLLMDGHNPKEAAEYFERALRIDTKNVSAMLDLTVCYDHIQETEKAYALTKTILNIDPNNVSALYNLGALLARKNDVAGAKKAWNKVIVLAPHSNDAKKAEAGLQQLGVR